MKFNYEYRTPDNVRHAGVVFASHREAAFQQLRQQGIRPALLVEAPGFFNKLFGKGKRWLAIGVLAVVALVAIVLASSMKAKVDEVESRELYESRCQIYGDPVLIAEASANGWAAVFASEGDRFLAEHAIPGVECGCRDRKGEWRRRIAQDLSDRKGAFVAIAEDDYAEVAQIKRIVNGMKRELASYLAEGGLVSGYMDRLDIRLRTEQAILRHAKEVLNRKASAEVWKAQNAELRAKGLPMLTQPD